MWPLSDREQLALELDEAPPKNAEELRARLQRLGLGGQYRVRLTTNRTVVVSYSGGELRIHNSFLDASEEVWRAIIIFVHGRTRVARTLVNYWGRVARVPGVSLRLVEVNGGPGALLLDARQRLLGVVALEVAGGQVRGISAIVNPDKLAHLGPVGDLTSLLGSAR